MTGRTPQRIRLSRAKGWRLPEGAVNVARPTKWGNPHRVKPAMVSQGVTVRAITPEQAVAAYLSDMLSLLAEWPSGRKLIKERLGGRDLACWCPLDQPCHADVLLELANASLRCEAVDV